MDKCSIMILSKLLKNNEGENMDVRKVGLIGMGAVGTVYGSLLNEKYGSNFVVISDESRKERLWRDGFSLNGKRFYPNVVSDSDKKIMYDLIIFCVKNYQLKSAIEDVRGFVGENTILITFLNGVTAQSEIQKAYPNNKVLYGLSIKIDAIRTEDGVINTVDGEIHFGEADNRVISEEVQAVANCFNEAGIQNIIFPDMIRMMWKKFMLNVGVNQVSAATGAAYGNVTGIKTNMILFREAMEEVLEIGKIQGIDLTEEDVEEYVQLMSGFSPNSKTSMLQDVEAKRKTEVDYFAGTVVEMGKKLGMPTPINHVLYCIIKSKEELY